MELCPESKWEELCKSDTTCTFYQTPAWHKIAARHYGAESVSFIFQVEGETACLPLLRKRRFGAFRYFSPFGTYTALVCPRNLGPEALASIEKALGKINLQLTSSPFTQNPLCVGEKLSSKVQLIDLSALDPGNPMRDWDEGQRRRVRVAKREGVTVRSAETSADWECYFRLYQLSLARWGGKARVAYPHELFEDIRSTCAQNPNVVLWLAEHDGEPGAGFLTFYHNRHVIPWHGGADDRFFALGATQILFLTMIEDAKQRGYSVFDLTGSGGLTGVEAFKARFGTKTVEFDSSLNRVGLYGFLSKLNSIRQ